MSKFVVLNWNSVDDISIAYEGDGSVMVFPDKKIAEKYAKENFPWNWMVVQVE